MASKNMYPVWPGWETVRQLGRGSFGAVYEIEREVSGHMERAALKVISIPQREGEIEELLSDGYDQNSISERFNSYLQNILYEYNTMADMRGCANIVSCDEVTCAQHEDGFGWDILVKMELLTPMPKWLGRTVSEAQAVKAGRDLCRALAYCEERNVLHRDIKPSNIFVSTDGTVKLGDFGVARAMDHAARETRTGAFPFMAPEVYNNEPYGPAADIYSLGLVLYWMMNEQRTPFLPLPPKSPSHTQETQARQRRFSGEALPDPAHGSAELKRIIRKACAYDPEERYRSAREMLADLEALHPADEGPDPGRLETASDLERFGTDPKTPAEKPRRKKEPERKPPAETKKKKKSTPIALGVIAALIALAALGYFRIHLWNPATCTEPETCRICGRTRGEAQGHDWGEWERTAEPDCTEPGEETRVCAVDPAHTETREIPALGHVWQDATCTEPAVCTVCSAESEGPLGHDWGEPEYLWSEELDSVTAKRVCRNDPSHVETETVETESGVEVPPSCEELGSTRYTARFENPAFPVQTRIREDIPATGHDWGEVEYVWTVDCASATATRVCRNDPAHVETETVETTGEVTLPPTCEAIGETTYTAAFESRVFGKQTKTAANLPELGHDWGKPEYFWADDGSNALAKRTCRNDPTHVESETVDTSAWISVRPSCEVMGSTTYTAYFRNRAFETQTQVIADVPATGHDWGEPTYTWSKDFSTATATRTCRNDHSHVETETARTVSRVTAKPTCGGPGSTAYSVEFTNPAFPAQEKIVDDIPALPHDWGEPTYTWLEGYESITATRVCRTDPSHVETETAKSYSRVNTDRSGKQTYTFTAYFRNSAFKTQETTLDELP